MVTKQKYTLADRRWVIEQAAGVYYEASPSRTPEQWRAAVHANGVGFDGPDVGGLPGNWIRYRGVHLSDAEVDTAIALGERWLRGEF